VPGGAFYLPLLGSFKKLDHPGEADEEDFGAYQSYKPRGVVDFDWIDSLDPSMGTGKSAAFQARRTRTGEIADLNRSDAVTGGALPVLLDHVRLKMTELVDGWLAGDILPAPARLGKDMPCSHCRYRPVCRYEFALRQTRTFARMSRSRVLEELTGQAGGDHA
jgi:ATP-dependent helicase/nuclease subunit B